jgi:hypothetical protein
MQPDTRCKEPAKYRYTWPGQPEAQVCERHARQLNIVAAVRRFDLHMTLLTEEELTTAHCSQWEREENI